MKNFSRFWGRGAVPGREVPGPGMIRAEAQWPLECKSPTEEVVALWAVDRLV